MSRVQFVKHDGYRLQPLWMRAIASKWLRSALTVSQSMVFHRGHSETRHVQMLAYRYGVTLNIYNRVVLAFYVESKQHVMGESELFLAVDLHSEPKL